MFDVLVELLIRTCSFRSIAVASTDDMAIGGIEVEGARHVVEVAKREVLRNPVLTSQCLIFVEVRLLCLDEPYKGHDLNFNSPS